MKRQKFISTCGQACIGIVALGIGATSCSSIHTITAVIQKDHLVVPLSAFEVLKKQSINYRSYVIVKNERLSYPIYLLRSSATLYQAFLMKCTHQGTELQAFGERLQCPAHGSEFNISGQVTNGPADQSLRKFNTSLKDESLHILLA